MKKHLVAFLCRNMSDKSIVTVFKYVLKRGSLKKICRLKPNSRSLRGGSLKIKPEMPAWDLSQ